MGKYNQTHAPSSPSEHLIGLLLYLFTCGGIFRVIHCARDTGLLRKFAEYTTKFNFCRLCGKTRRIL